jgi:hypothetical protein
MGYDFGDYTQKLTVAQHTLVKNRAGNVQNSKDGPGGARVQKIGQLN